jgi:hypothetical protein
MKKLTVLAVALLFVAVAVTSASADTSNSAVASVYVDVVSNVSLSSVTPLVNLGSVQTGFFPAVLTWRVDANMEAVSFFIEASDLYKGDDPTDPTVAPIPLATFMPARITAEEGNEMASGDNKAFWQGTGAPIGAYPTSATEAVTYESSQNGHFSQNVTTVLTYNQVDPEQPMGQYSGKVRFTAFLGLTESASSKP